MPQTIRAAAFPADYPAIADVLSAEAPDWPTTPADLTQEDATRDPDLYHAVLIAEEQHIQGPQYVGVAFLEQDTLAHRHGKFLINIRVRPEKQRQGIGSQLYQALLQHLAPLHPRELQTEVWETQKYTIDFLRRRGFIECWQRIDSDLTIADFDATPYTDLEAQLLADGITITTYAQLQHDPERDRKLYELDWTLWQDIPYGEQPTQRSLEQFIKAELQTERFLPDACFIAVKDAQFLGYSSVTRRSNRYVTEMTGVLPAYRGLHIATALKVKGILYVRQQAGTIMSTTNDAVNHAMLALNHKLGFRRIGATIRYSKII